jgi:hypothetical protein
MAGAGASPGATPCGTQAAATNPAALAVDKRRKSRRFIGNLVDIALLLFFPVILVSLSV